jgi:sporulation protein YlmC with PRC-barrel domain
LTDKKKSIPQSKILGMRVYNSDGTLVGDVKDLGLVPGDKEITLHVQTKAGVKEIDWDMISAVGDVILLSTVVEVPQITEAQSEVAKTSQVVTTDTSTPPTCPQCGKPGTYISQYQRWYCYTDKRYL